MPIFQKGGFAKKLQFLFSHSSKKAHLHSICLIACLYLDASANFYESLCPPRRPTPLRRRCPPPPPPPPLPPIREMGAVFPTGTYLFFH